MLGHAKTFLAALLGVAAALLIWQWLAVDHVDHSSRRRASATIATPANRETVKEIEGRMNPGPDIRDRLGECKILISWSRSQLRREHECEQEVWVSWAHGDTSPPALRAGRFR